MGCHSAAPNSETYANNTDVCYGSLAMSVRICIAPIQAIYIAQYI